jgi:Predicted acetyltransferase
MDIKLGCGLKPQTIIDFADLIFSKAHRPHDFATLLPKNYGPGRTKPENHVVALDDDGGLLGMVMFDPFDLTVGGETLKAVCVGTVSVHPRARGMGVMKKLMDKMGEQPAVKNADLVVLGGRRQRYEYYGFTLSGEACRYTIDADNNRHALLKMALTVTSLTDAHIEAVMEIAHRKDVHVKHEADLFLEVQKSWNARPVAILDGDEVVGFADVVKEEGRISQMALASSEYDGAAVKALYEYMDEGAISFEISADDTLNAFFARIAAGMSIHWHNNYRIQRFDRVIAAFMKMKNAKTPLEKGAFSLAVEGVGRITIEVNEQGVQVNIQETNEKGIPPMDACRFFFSSHCGYLPISAPRGWFPLPLYIPACELC